MPRSSSTCHIKPPSLRYLLRTSWPRRQQGRGAGWLLWHGCASSRTTVHREHGDPMLGHAVTVCLGVG